MRKLLKNLQPDSGLVAPATSAQAPQEPSGSEWVGDATSRDARRTGETGRSSASGDAIIVALDVPDAEAAREVARALRGRVKWVKVGMTLYYSAGPQIVRELRSMGFKVFVDLKLHDIPHQVEGACRTLTRVGADMITLHASGGSAMLSAGVRAAAAAAERFGTQPPIVIAVSVLTSLDDAALAEVGCPSPAAEQVDRLVVLAQNAGCAGVVCSPLETARVRELLGPDAVIVTPGIRPKGQEAGDQARIATPAEALAAGSTYLVIGRPITGAADPAAAVDNISREL